MERRDGDDNDDLELHFDQLDAQQIIIKMRLT